MAEHELEMSVGETVQVGDYLLTVVDIEGDEVSFRVDSCESDDCVVGLGEAARK